MRGLADASRFPRVTGGRLSDRLRTTYRPGTPAGPPEVRDALRWAAGHPPCCHPTNAGGQPIHHSFHSIGPCFAAFAARTGFRRGVQDSNLRHTDSSSVALPTELTIADVHLFRTHRGTCGTDPILHAVSGNQFLVCRTPLAGSRQRLSPLQKVCQMLAVESTIPSNTLYANDICFFGG